METLTPNPNLEFKDKVFGLLINMKVGAIYDIKEKVSPEKRTTFVNCVKEFIDYDNGKFKKFYIEFSNDYLSLKKFEYSKVVLEAPRQAPPAITDTMLTDLETYFSSAMLPTAIQISEYENILDVGKFVKSHLSYVRQNRGFASYYEKLIQLKNILDESTPNS